MKNYICLLSLFLFLSLNAQSNDSINTVKSNKLSSKHFIIPAVLMGGGVLLLNSTENKNLQLNLQNALKNNFHTSADDYLQFAPIAQVYIGHLMGFESKNNLKQQTVNLLVANLITGGIIVGLKNAFQETRPDFSNNKSFPSGHTATAFTNASILFFEYKDSNIWYASSGYLFSTATGFLRVANNKHYTSDVLAGAGIGMAVGFAVSYWSPFKSFSVTKNKKTQAFIYPQIGDSFGLSLLIKN